MELKKTTRILLSLALLVSFTLASFGGLFEHKAAAASNPKKAYVAGTTVTVSGGNKATLKGIDLFMGKADANAYAAKLNTSYKSTIAWGAASFIPQVGPYISAAGIANTIVSQQSANKILALTKKNKKVHVATINGSMKVSEWNGTASSVKTSLPKNNTVKYGSVTSKTTTTINKKEIKY